MARWLPSVVSGLTALLVTFSDQISGLIAANPKVAGVLMALYAILSHLFKSPVAPAEPSK